MRKNTHTNITSLLLLSQGTAMTVLFFFIAGLSAGAFVELFLESDAKLQLADYLTQNLPGSGVPISLSPVFFQSAANNLGLLLLIFAAGMTVIGFPAALLAIAYKGMALGFSSALLIQSLSGKGIKMILFTMLPQNLILLPALLLAALAAVNLASLVYSDRNKGMKKSLQASAGSYLSLFLLLAALVLAGCLIEAFISPALLQLAG